MRKGQKISEEQAIAVNLGESYRRLKYLAARIARAQSRGRAPAPADLAAVRELKAQISRLKTGRDAFPREHEEKP